MTHEAYAVSNATAKSLGKAITGEIKSHCWEIMKKEASEQEMGAALGNLKTDE